MHFSILHGGFCGIKDMITCVFNAPKLISNISPKWNDGQNVRCVCKDKGNFWKENEMHSDYLMKTNIAHIGVMRLIKL